jgi:hypothetical protein
MCDGPRRQRSMVRVINICYYDIICNVLQVASTKVWSVMKWGRDGVWMTIRTEQYIFSSTELKAQVSYSDRPLSVVCLAGRLSVRLSVNFYIFDFFSRTTGPILTRLGTNHFWGEGILNCSNEGDYNCLSSRGDNSKRVKIHWNF